MKGKTHSTEEIIRILRQAMVSSLSLPNFSRKGAPFLHRPYVIG